MKGRAIIICRYTSYENLDIVNVGSGEGSESVACTLKILFKGNATTY